MKKNIALLVFSLFVSIASAQPFADIVSFNYQTYSGKYEKTFDTLPQQYNKTDNYLFGFFLPKEFKNGNTLLIRINSETINSTISPDSSYSSRLSNVSLPIGMKLVNKNKKWETIFLVIPKIASDFKDKVDGYDFQYGAVFLEHFVPNNKLKIKAGLYYNREAFGNFYVPLVGVDWKVNNRIYMYGILPTSYKIEFNILKNKLYTGINLKYFTRSFRLSKVSNYDYVRYDEAQVKLFVDCFVAKKVLVFGEVGYSIGTNPWQYKYNTKEVVTNSPVYNSMKPFVVFNTGLAYRFRFDLEEKQAQ